MPSLSTALIATRAVILILLISFVNTSVAHAQDCNLNGLDDTLEADLDADGVINACDNCLEVSNADQFDSNGDGYGNLCDADLDNNGIVNFIDLSLWTNDFLGSNPDADFNGDGLVNFADFVILTNAIFAPPGPGLPEANTTPIAVAGVDVSAETNEIIEFDGSSSSDANDDNLTYSWTIVQRPPGSNAILESANTFEPKLVPDAVGAWQIELIVNDGETDSLPSTLDVTVDTSLSLPPEATWMQNIESSLLNKRLRNVMLPGTHDSATYAISSSSPVTRDCFINLPSIACTVATQLPGVAQAQSFNLLDQLAFGIRYLDLRWCEERDGDGIFTCHSLEGSPLAEVLNDIDVFLSETEQEIVYVDNRFFYGFEDTDHEVLINAFRERFGDLMISESDLLETGQLLEGDTALDKMHNVTFDWMWQNNKRVIVGFGPEKNDSNCPNDDIQSLRLEHLSAGSLITLFDKTAPESFSSDFLTILVKQDIDYRTINSLEASFEDAELEVVYTSDNGLNGDVSRLDFDGGGTVSTSGLVRLYKSANAQEEDLVCQLKLNTSGVDTFDFTQGQDGFEERDPYPVLQPEFNDIWISSDLMRDNSFAGTTELGTLMRKNTVTLPNLNNKFHLLQMQFTPGISDILELNANLFNLAAQSNPQMVQNVQDHWTDDDNVNVVMIDFFQNTNLVDLAIANNTVILPPSGVPGWHLFEKHDIGNGQVAVSGGSVCRGLLTVPISIDFTESQLCDNDSADSAIFYDLEPGQVIRLYDDKLGSFNPANISQDDWIEIVVLEPVEDLILDSFEELPNLTFLYPEDLTSNAPDIFNNGDFRVVRHGQGNLNDRVSRIEYALEAIGGVVDIMSGDNGTGDLLCSIPVQPSNAFNFETNQQCDNDRARSIVMYDVPAGTFMRLYDSPEGAENDDWAQVNIKQNVERFVINNFESDINTPFVEMIVLRDNGLAGSVSRFEYDTVDTLAATPPTIEFFDQNDTFGKAQCQINAAIIATIDPLTTELFLSPGDLGCSNDSIRSMALRNLPAGLRIRICDRSDCDPIDDVSVTTVLQSSKYYRINTFEQAFNDGIVEQIFIENNGLDGKVSRIGLED
ncbi:MAG: hypothetical protein AB8G18_14675 [Gammaproteobacteria bacterium]